MSNFINRLFYLIKPAIPRKIQIGLRRKIVKRKLILYNDVWPVNKEAGNKPEGWNGWPGNKKFALVLTHDVESAKGCERCIKLMELEKSLGFKSSFNFVPERYHVSPELRKKLTDQGFEVGIHGLTHDGKLYSSQEEFNKRAVRINHYLRDWNAVGFRSPAMHHNLKWLLKLNIEYDASTFDTDPFEPQSEGANTIFPFWVSGNSVHEGYVELPYTLPQDFTLFVLLEEKSIHIWKRKFDWIAQNGGMVLLNTHPDYMNFNRGKPGLEEYPIKYYTEFLEYLNNRYENNYWHAVPRKVAQFWKMSMISD